MLLVRDAILIEPIRKLASLRCNFLVMLSDCGSGFSRYHFESAQRRASWVLLVLENIIVNFEVISENYF